MTVVCVLVSAGIGATTLIMDSGMPADLQAMQWRWLSAMLTTGLPLWIAVYILQPCQTNHSMLECVEWTIIGFGAVQALYGMAQIAGLYPSRHSLFVLTGTFYNPGPYSGYLAAAFPVTLRKMLSVRHAQGYLPRIEYYLSLTALLLIASVLPAGMSRAAWMATLVSIGYVLLCMYQLQAKSFILKFRYYVFAVLMVGAIGFAGAYLMKKDSADGRVFIWKITSQAIAVSPMGETEGRTFSALYGDAQERYFAYGSGSPAEEWVAGTPDFAFNEYLQLTAEKGVMVSALFIIFLSGLLYGTRKNERLIGIRGCLVSLMLFACFSYPLHIPAIVSLWVLAILILVEESFLAVTKRPRKQFLLFAKGVLILVTSGCVVGCVNAYRTNTAKMLAVREWMPIRALYNYGAYKAAAEGYEKLYDGMNWHDEFCFEYGRSLYNLHRNEDAERILLHSMKISGDPMILNLLGRNAQDMGNYEEAEDYLVRATHRVPERTYPHYLLVKLYSMSEYFQKEKLLKEAGHVLQSKPKVSSTAIMEMKHEVKKILSDNGLSKELENWIYITNQERRSN